MSPIESRIADRSAKVVIVGQGYVGLPLAMRASRVGFGDVVGYDVAEARVRAIDAASTKPFGFMRFTPGPGVDGHCLPIDPSYLAWSVRRRLGHTFRFVELANDVDEHMPEYVHTRVTALLNAHRRSVNGTRVLLLGLAYKANTSDARESPSIEVAQRLARGGAAVRFCDPHVPDVNVDGVDHPLVEFTPTELAAADLVVVLVDHDDFDPALIAEHAPLVFDTRDLLRGRDFTGETL